MPPPDTGRGAVLTRLGAGLLYMPENFEVEVGGAVVFVIERRSVRTSLINQRSTTVRLCRLRGASAVCDWEDKRQ